MQVSPQWRSSNQPTNNLQFRFYVITLIVAVAAMSYATTRLGMAMRIPPYDNSPFWPTNALVLAVLLLVPQRKWPILILTAYLTAALFGLRTETLTLSSLWMFIAALVEVLIAAFGVTYFLKGTIELTSVAVLARYSMIAIFASFIAAFVGALAGTQGSYWMYWRMWAILDAGALLTVAPTAWGAIHSRSRWMHRPHKSYLEAVAFLLCLGCVGYINFIAAGKTSSPALLYSLVPLLLWSAFRFGWMGVTASVVTIASMSILGAIHNRGPFAQLGSPDNLLSLQIFLVVAAIPFMVLAAIVEERRRTGEALKKSEEKFSRAFRQSPLAITLTSTRDDRFVEVNEAFQRATGYTSKEVIGRTPAQLGLWMYPVDRVELTTRLLAGETVRNIEGHFRMKDGTTRVGLTSAELIEIDGEPCIVGVAADITDRKEMEHALRNSEVRERTKAKELETVLEALPIPVLIAHDAQCKVITANRAGCELLRAQRGANISRSASLETPRKFRIMRDGVEVPAEHLPMQRAAATAKPVFGSRNR